MSYRGRLPPFNLMSNRPGIGADFFDDVLDPAVYLSDGVDNHKIKVPRIVSNKLALTDPDLYDIIKNHKRTLAKGHSDLLKAQLGKDYFDYLQTLEDLHKQRTDMIHRDLGGAVPIITGPWHGEHGTYVGEQWSDPTKSFPLMMTSDPDLRTTRNVWFSHSETASNTPLSVGIPYQASSSSEPVMNNHSYPANLWFMNPVPHGSDAPTEYTMGIDINALRLAVVTQQYYEALARSGSRYEEQILTLFGVSNPDSRIQHPEYLGGNRVAINVREITNTAQGEQDFLGDVGAQSVTADSHGDFSRSFTEHGHLIGLACARYDHLYADGLDRKWSRVNKFDYYNPIFSGIGEQPIYTRELYSANGVPYNQVFGYNEAWVHYRTNHNVVSGSLRPKASSNLGHWTLADNYSSAPTLSSDWLKEDATNVDRALAVTSTLENQIFADFYFDIKHTRVMPVHSIPGQLNRF
ncbi:unnamed protein product [Cylicocyclus nassatus]|uniref:Major capsid protein n=1 Tax=Cylicocyclus nassatus TaxID=53992 RepID=A0AA36M740_CYLNA|nr:unnamed protein product [Cylicocyclus nassatus]CAJ0600666.1 unnamed protein product [Cylicocyclus nassatus]CAJ0600667.1 unnamed protein product [Cylicocyclus nassatus]